MGPEERLEAPTLIGVEEAEEHDGIFPHVGVHVDQDVTGWGIRFEGGKGATGH